MRTVFILFTILVGLGVLPAPAAWAESAIPEVTSVRFAGAGEVTRVVIETDRPVDVSSRFSWKEGQAAILLDMPLSLWNLGGVPRSGGAGEGFGSVTGYRYGQAGPDVTRLVLELSAPVEVIRELSLPPSRGQPNWRYALDLRAGQAAPFIRQARRDARKLDIPEMVALSEGPMPPTSSVKQEQDKPLVDVWSPALRRIVIVIDPGHGGKDPGAVAKSGLMEKEVNLKAALALRALLAADPRFDVRMTRETDVFIELQDRVELARKWGAELFISIHADASPDSTARGAAVYTLSERGSKRSAALVEDQDWELPLGTDEETPDEVVDILSELLVRETKSNSSDFAKLLITELGSAGPMLRNSHRNAGFVVLFAPDVPAVLLELGFLTNPSDSKRLASNDGRQKSAVAVARAIQSYFDARPGVYAGASRSAPN